ncbi:Tetratricopeptide repeat domain protein [Halomicronema hongdechloris C2206]|uniref:Tetratricopeptide repeat domain protein n=1 Tax=Halomicronema hongdechloris C2206 TaxID=1641165 RepID=A0A1Z3HJT3_9CYAN|nr:tetratricopeptide repeat protein [Halomicronema hongdechloris]ASC70584.1 Tetratricopeptide repeat domain protein [Halomicronema hongdechloris C2206]
MKVRIYVLAWGGVILSWLEVPTQVSMGFGATGLAAAEISQPADSGEEVEALSEAEMGLSDQGASLHFALTWASQHPAATATIPQTEASQHLETLQTYRREASQYIAQATALLTTGEIDAALDSYDRAIQLWQQGLELLQSQAAPDLQREFLLGLSLAFGVVGEQHRQVQRYDQALATTEQGLRYGQRLLALTDAADGSEDAFYPEALNALQLLYSNLGFIYAGQHLYPEALAAQQQALAMAAQLDDPALMFRSLTAIYATHVALSDYRQALTINERRLAIATTLEDPDGQLSALIGLGRTYHDLGRYPEALAHHQRALFLAREHSRLRDEISSLNNLGLTHSVLGRYDEALTALNTALSLTRELRQRLQTADTLELDRACFPLLSQEFSRTDVSRQFCLEGTWLSESKILNTMASVYEAQGRYSEALERYQQSLAIAKEHLQGSPLYSKQDEATFLNNIGGLHGNRGDYDQAREYYQQAFALQTAIADRQGMAVSLNNIGALYETQGRYPEALNQLNRALELAEALGLQTLKGSVLSNLGSIYRQQGEFERAAALYQASLELDRSLGRRDDVAVSFNNLGLLKFEQGQYGQAIDYVQQALAIHRAIGQRPHQIIDLNNLGSYYRAQGRYADSLGRLQQALGIAQEIGNRSGQAYALLQLGKTHRQLGQYEPALAFSQPALSLFQAMGDRTGEAATLADQGLIYAQQNRHELALQSFEAALAIYRTTGDVAGESITLQQVGFLHEKAGDYPAAETAFQQTLAIQQQIGARGFEGISLQGLGTVYAAQGHPRALETLQRAIARHRDVGNRPREADALNNQGAALIRAGKFSQAEAVLRQSLDLFESLRTDLLDDQLIAILDSQASAYANLERALIAQDKPTEALAITERGRARAFVLQLAGRLSKSAKPNWRFIPRLRPRQLLKSGRLPATTTQPWWPTP